MTKLSPVRFSSAVPIRSPGLLLKNSRSLLGDYCYGKIYNLQNFKSNALILSSAVQVTSRIWQAHRSAKETRCKPEGMLRYTEFIKTTFREIMGFVLSYLVLRRFQWLVVTAFKRWFTVAPVKNGHSFSGIFGTVRKLGRELLDCIRGTQKKWTPDSILPGPPKLEVVFKSQPGRRQFYKDHIEPWVDRVNRWSGKEKEYQAKLLRKELTPTGLEAARVQTFLDWAAPIIASVPTLFLAGFLLERFNQRHSEALAEKISQFLKRGKTEPVRADNSITVNSAGSDKSQTPSQFHETLDQSGPYADNQVTAVSPSRGLFYGLPFPGIRSDAAQWFRSYSYLPWGGSGLSAPYISAVPQVWKSFPG